MNLIEEWNKVVYDLAVIVGNDNLDEERIINGLNETLGDIEYIPKEQFELFSKELLPSYSVAPENRQELKNLMNNLMNLLLQKTSNNNQNNQFNSIDMIHKQYIFEFVHDLIATKPKDEELNEYIEWRINRILPMLDDL